MQQEADEGGEILLDEGTSDEEEEAPQTQLRLDVTDSPASGSTTSSLGTALERATSLHATPVTRTSQTPGTRTAQPPGTTPAIASRRASAAATTRPPSSTRSHRGVDDAGMAIARALEGANHEMRAFTQTQQSPVVVQTSAVRSAITEATQRLETHEKVRNLTLRRRVQLVKQLRVDGNAEFVIGLGDETLGEFIQSMIEDVDAASNVAPVYPHYPQQAMQPQAMYWPGHGEGERRSQ